MGARDYRHNALHVRTACTTFKYMCAFILVLSAICSCKEDKVEFDPLEPPIVAEPEAIILNNGTGDTLTIYEGLPSVILFKTVPTNLDITDSLKPLFTDHLGAAYPYMKLSTPALQSDSTWLISVSLLDGGKSGDIISLTIFGQKSNTTFSSKPMALKVVSPRVLLSDTIFAFEKGSKATVRFRTEPWNLLLADGFESKAEITDTLGLETDMYNVGDMEFQPDSTWSVELKFTNTRLSNGTGAVKIVCPDTTLLSGKFTITRVAFQISQLKFKNGLTLTEGKTNAFSGLLPTTTDFTKEELKIIHNGDKLTVGDSIIEKSTSKYNTLDLSKPVTVTLWKYDLKKDYTITLSNTNLPVVRIRTPKAITSKEVWTEGCSMKIELPDGAVAYEGSLSMRGRGNGTWTETEKKPYLLRLDEKSKILGMHKQKRWILLANFKDYTLLRNDAALWLSKQTGLPYTVNGQYVELELNGEHRGNYYLCEQIRIDNNRIDIDDPNLDHPEEGGILLNIDSYLHYNDYGHQKDLGFFSDIYHMPYIFKDPDENDINTSHALFKYVKSFVHDMESSLNNRSKVLNHDYEKYIDVSSAIDFALIQELTMNHDSYNTWPQNGPHSTYVHMDKNHTGGKLCFGPVWDFDYHTFMPVCWDNGTDLAKSWMILNISQKTGSGRYYFPDMVKDPKFKEALVNRWNELKDKFALLPDYIDMMADSIRVSESVNRKIWFDKTDNTQNGDRTDFNIAVSRMKEGFTKRWQWIDANISKL